MIHVHSGALFSKGSEWFCISLCKAHAADKFSAQSFNDTLECVSKRKIRKFEWILRQFKEETRRLSSAKSSFVTQKWRKRRRNCGLGNF